MPFQGRWSRGDVGAELDGYWVTAVGLVVTRWTEDEIPGNQDDLGLRPWHAQRVGNRFGGGQGPGLYLNNASTDVFLDVLMLAASDLALTSWELRFTSWLALHDQALLGRGAVGFSLDDIDWGTASEYRARKRFVLAVIDSARRGDRWGELAYEPDHRAGLLDQYRRVVEAFEPPGGPSSQAGFPEPGEEQRIACCTRHRVMAAPLDDWRACRFCMQGL